MSILSNASEKLVQTAIGLAPESWLPGGTPDPLSVKHGLIGAAVSRLDGPLKVAGKARYAAEVPMEGLLYAALVHSTIARGRIKDLDAAAAEAAPGVALVMSFKNAPRLKPPAVFGTSPTAAGATSLPVMQDAEIRWNGQPVAVVLAETQEQANEAAGLISVRTETLPAEVSFEQAKARLRRPEKIMREANEIAIGDAEAALAQAEVKLDLAFSTARTNHNAIELHAATCAWDGDRLTIHDASQLVAATAATIADMFGLKADHVRVLSPYVGGGFGGKCLWDHQILGAAAARLAGRPVRIVLSRESVYRLVGGRTQTQQRVALGANRDGKLTALIHTGVAATRAEANCPEQFSFPARHLYASKTFKIVQDLADMDMLANTFMRAPGESIGTFALECAIDEMAEKLGMDPVEFRRGIEPGTDPTSGREFSSRRLLDAYAAGAERFGWSKRNPVPRSRREGEWLIGMGCATGTYPYYRMPGGAASITLRADGVATVAAAAHEMGMGTATVQTQIAAERLGLPVEKVRFVHGDTALPPSPVAGGSSQTASVGAAVIAAHGSLMKALVALIGNDSPLAGLSMAEVEARDGGLAKRDEPDRFESYVSILKRAGRNEVTVQASASAPLEMEKWSMHSFAAQFCEARVSEVTGEVRISRFVGSFDCGRILNAKTAASQFRGGIIMGLGLALMEETLLDERTGRVANATLAEYHVPVHLDAPGIEVIWTDIPDPHTPMGARGIGEIGITGVAAAVANAVYNATGKRIRDLPITLDKLL